MAMTLLRVIADSIAVATLGGAAMRDAKVADWFSSRRHVASGKLRHVAALQIGPAPCRRWQASTLLVAVGCLVNGGLLLVEAERAPEDTVVLYCGDDASSLPAEERRLRRRCFRRKQATGEAEGNTGGRGARWPRSMPRLGLFSFNARRLK